MTDSGRWLPCPDRYQERNGDDGKELRGRERWETTTKEQFESRMTCSTQTMPAINSEWFLRALFACTGQETAADDAGNRHTYRRHILSMPAIIAQKSKVKGNTWTVLQGGERMDVVGEAWGSR